MPSGKRKTEDENPDNLPPLTNTLLPTSWSPAPVVHQVEAVQEEGVVRHLPHDEHFPAAADFERPPEYRRARKGFTKKKISKYGRKTETTGRGERHAEETTVERVCRGSWLALTSSRGPCACQCTAAGPVP